MQHPPPKPRSAQNPTANVAQTAELTELAATMLERKWPGARVSSIDSMRSDASSRTYARINIDPASSSAPTSVVAMLMGSDTAALSSEELNAFEDQGPSELPFLSVGRFLAKFTDALPVVEAASDDGSVLFLEDIGDTTLWAAANIDTNGPQHWFKSALDWIADISKRARDDGSRCPAFAQRFDVRLFNWEFEHFIEYGTAKAPAQLLKETRAELATTAGHLDSLPPVFVHRDFHAWNIHVHNERVRVIDFQDALLGPALYDVASLLTDRCTPELITPKIEDELICHFHQSRGLSDSIDSTRRDYYLLGLQRSLKVIGRFNYLADKKGKPQYRDMLPDVVATAARFLSIDNSMERTKELFDGYLRDGNKDQASDASAD